MKRITDKKIEKWLDTLYDLKNKVNRIHSEIYDCGVSDDDMDSLANMTCNFDEAVSEVGDLKEILLRIE
jgi:hypothetical protein